MWKDMVERKQRRRRASRRLGALAAGLSLGMSLSANAAVLTESGDTGELPETAQAGGEAAGTALDAIEGTIATSDDNDMYKIVISDPGNFSASLVNAGTPLADTLIWLFDANGRGLLVNDDQDPGFFEFRSELPTGSFTGAAGVYYLAVSVFFNTPMSDSGFIFDDLEFGGQAGTFGPNGPGGADPVTSWDSFLSSETGAYRIELTGAEFMGAGVPVPSFSWWGAPLLLIFALAGVVFTASRRRALA